MREKLSAAGLGLLVAAIVTVSATFAWVTLSRAPEVSGMATTLAANGALEIALSNEAGKQPDEFDIDESVKTSVDLISSNLQWGNLVNLSHPDYGIESIDLRPAQLNTASLKNNPLLGAAYGQDGRVTEMDKNFAYTKYNKVEGKFTANATFGVRAISSYKKEASQGAQLVLEQKIKAVDTSMAAVSNDYQDVIRSFPAMGTMISRFAQDKINAQLGSGSAQGSDMGPYLADVVTLYQTLYKTMQTQKDAYVALANLQWYQWCTTEGMNFTEVDWDTLYNNRAKYDAADPSGRSSDAAISLSGLNQFCKDENQVKTDMDTLAKYRDEYVQNHTAYYWSSIAPMINRLIDYSKTMYMEVNGQKVLLGSINSSNAFDLLRAANGKTQKVFVDGGILKRFEQNVVAASARFGQANKAGCVVAVKASLINVTINGEAYTTASGPSWFESDFSRTSATEVDASVIAAEDTYGMAVDFWLRTNAERTYLTLEGATVIDAGSGTVLRYDGVNRVWGAAGNALLSRESTTQGGGSCYVYYADTPEDQARSLALLGNMKVAFMDTGTGRYMASAVLDTEHYWAENGRVTVPLVQDTTQPKVSYTHEETEIDKDGNETTVKKEYYAIAELTMDTAQRITAIIYLDGTSLTNSEVLAAASIQGQLNLQFGTSDDLQTVGSNDLIDDVRAVTAAVDKTKMNYDDGTDLTANVTVTVKGTQPTEVSAFFVRAINSTQGSRETEMKFTKLSTGDNVWATAYTFTAPGTYYLRHVQLDGVDYALSEPIKVEVTGFALKSVSWSHTGNSATIRTSQSTQKETVTVEFSSNDPNKLPTSVEARFVRTDGYTVIIPLTKGSGGVWTGTGTFTTSGVYKWEYLVYTTRDGKALYKDLGSDKKTLDLALGLYAQVQHSSGTMEDRFEVNTTYTKEVTVKILDNANNELKELENATLVYSSGSALSGHDYSLVWDHNSQYYTCTMVFEKAGRYRFSHIKLQDGNTITKVSESPVYNIISPDPLIYDTNSQTTYHGTDNIQFVPLTCDAQIDRIRITNSNSSNTVKAVVYNSGAGYKTADASCDGSVWTVKLPTYWTGPEGEQVQTQDGDWSVAALLLSECYDDSGYHDGTNPLIWVNDDEASIKFIENMIKDQFTADDGTKPTYVKHDFSRLSTTVSSSVQITAVQDGDMGTDGVVKLGSKSTPFMTKFNKKDLGLTVRITDGQGRLIPPTKIGAVTLGYDYGAPTTDKYGYAVETGASERDAHMTLVWDADLGVYRVSDQTAWSYVGKYDVKKLDVTFVSGTNSTRQTVQPGSSGLPTAYTITTQGPDLQKNVTVQLNKQGVLSVKRGILDSNVIGVFLQSYNVGEFYAAVSVTDNNGEPVNYVSLGSSVQAELILTYLDGNEARNGGYFWTGDSSYANISLTMEKQPGGNYVAKNQTPLLAGGYSASVKVTIDGNEIIRNYTNGNTNGNDQNRVIEVWSMAPDVTMALASGREEEPVTVNRTAGTAASNDTFSSNNKVLLGGHSAVLFAAYDVWDASENPGTYTDFLGDNYNQNGEYAKEFAHYTMPIVKFTLGNLTAGGGATTSCSDFSLQIPVDGTTVTLKNGIASDSITIGKITEDTAKRNGTYGKLGLSCQYTYKTEAPVVIGTQEIKVIQAQTEGAVYTVNLKTPLSIVQENKAVPSATYEGIDSRFVTPDPVYSNDGRAFTVTLPEALYTADGKTSVKTSKEEMLDNNTIGQDPSDKLTPISQLSDTGWVKAAGSDEVKVGQIYVQTLQEKSSSHTSPAWSGGHVLSKKAWQYTYTQTKYELYKMEQRWDATVDVTNANIGTETRYQLFDEVRTLKGWSVDGVEKAPGSEVTISGNSIIRPIYNDTIVETGTKVVTEQVTGTAHFKYHVTCTATVPREKASISGDQNPIEGTTPDLYCENDQCKKYKAKGSKSNALAAAKEQIPGLTGYEYRETLTTTRENVSTEWQYDGVLGTSTRVTKYYDVDGNLTGERND